MSKETPGKEARDPLYPRIVLIPMVDGWLVEVDFSESYCTATGPFDDVHDALNSAMIRLDKQNALDDEEENFKNRKSDESDQGY